MRRCGSATQRNHLREEDSTTDYYQHVNFNEDIEMYNARHRLFLPFNYIAMRHTDYIVFYNPVNIYVDSFDLWTAVPCQWVIANTCVSYMVESILSTYLFPTTAVIHNSVGKGGG